MMQFFTNIFGGSSKQDEPSSLMTLYLHIEKAKGFATNLTGSSFSGNAMEIPVFKKKEQQLSDLAPLCVYKHEDCVFLAPKSNFHPFKQGDEYYAYSKPAFGRAPVYVYKKQLHTGARSIYFLSRNAIREHIYVDVFYVPNSAYLYPGTLGMNASEQAIFIRQSQVEPSSCEVLLLSSKKRQNVYDFFPVEATNQPDYPIYEIYTTKYTW